MIKLLLLLAWLPGWHAQSHSSWDECGSWLLWADVRWQDGIPLTVDWGQYGREQVWFRQGRDSRGIVAVLEPGVDVSIPFSATAPTGAAICTINQLPANCTEQDGGVVLITEQDWRRNHDQWADGRPCPELDGGPIFANGFEGGDTSAWSKVVTSLPALIFRDGFESENTEAWQ